MADAPSTLDAASERIRETAKWLTISLAALGGVLVGTTQLSDIGALELRSDRFWMAVVGAAIAAIGSGVILFATVATAAAPALSLEQLATHTPKGAKDAVKDQTLLEGRSNVQALKDEYIGAIEDRERAYVDHLADLSNEIDRNKFVTANARAVALNGIVKTIVGVSAYRELARLWRAARVKIIVGGALAALGVGTFAWAANPPDKVVASAAEPAILAAPEPTKITLTAVGREALGPKLGTGCPLTSPISVLQLGSTDAGPDVLVQQPGCAAVRFVVVPAWGSVG
ncbi:hypothetical protein E1263_09645 [Kribbella antibiotica]|uniref:Uncharacterized protein n=1 Tax=Kribbella antibiotica TaxID=190195 RepID=A0A4R4ZPL2_9ACTN|nr:hypothetical protein [Kribbella antibiotica]TDD60868.1 hypothetical protein E1263_09645 [Kribbella antibiotica]